MSFPAARCHALEKMTGDAYASQILSDPNNILGIEYLKALKKLNSPIVPFTLKREFSGYHDTELHDCSSSASAIRKVLMNIPASPYRLLSEPHESLCKYQDVSEELSNRIIRNRNQFRSFGQFCTLLKTKELTYSRISRSLLHILLSKPRPRRRSSDCRQCFIFHKCCMLPYRSLPN